VKKSGEMAASQSDGAAAVEFVEKRSFESTESHNDDAAEVRTLVSQPQPQPLSRLQKQAPAKMQVTRLSLESMGLCCRSPIPFLSPILVSPLGGRDLEKLLLTEEAGKQNPADEKESVGSVVIPTNGWQHPAAPFLVEKVCSSNCFVELCVQDRCCS